MGVWGCRDSSCPSRLGTALTAPLFVCCGQAELRLASCVLPRAQGQPQLLVIHHPRQRGAHSIVGPLGQDPTIHKTRDRRPISPPWVWSPHPVLPEVHHR